MRVENMERAQGIMTLMTMSIIFSSNALYSTASSSDWLRTIAAVNTLTCFVNGIRYFALGGNFTALGTHN